MPKFALYYYPQCPYCQIVLRVIEKHHLEVELRNTRQNPQWGDELYEARKRSTVPVLRIEKEDGEVQWMGESRDIAKYLATRPE